MGTALDCVLDTKRRRFLAVLLGCGIMSVVYQSSLLRNDRAIELISSISGHFGLRYDRAASRSHGRGLQGTRGSIKDLDLLKHLKPWNHYDFVALKKKPGWHFVDFPVHYWCNTSNVSVSVRYTTVPVDIIGADVVLFTTGPFTLEEWDALHRYRSPKQVWVFATQEPAAIIADFLPPKVYRNSTYNWSFTFHSTSHIHGAYGWYTPHDNTKLERGSKKKNWHAAKPNLAAWVSSRHCTGLGWNRTQFVLDLDKHMGIDLFGKCGRMNLRKNTQIATDVFTKYKFHISLENSCCSEYLSEKVWNSLEKWESVPIVLGGSREEYQRLMPPHSYIHADDFDSIEDLARYIKTVGNNATLYNEYFAWRHKGTVHQQDFHYRFPVFFEGACKVADKLKQVPRETILEQDSFDPYGPDWFGSCYRCGDHDWIQDYNLWDRLKLFGHDWEDNRTLHWQHKH